MERGLIVIGSMGAFFTAYAAARGAAEIADTLYDTASEVMDLEKNITTVVEKNPILKLAKDVRRRIGI